MSCGMNNEESPMSDTKMDISDATNPGSDAVSPLFDGEQTNENDKTFHSAEYNITVVMNNGIHDNDSPNDGREITSDDHVKYIINQSKERQCRTTDRASDNEASITKHDMLDNRCADNIDPPAQLPISERNISNLTVANIHPLMSPSGTDSDSENSCPIVLQCDQNSKYTNFPDVVPNKEHVVNSRTMQNNELPFSDDKTKSVVNAINSNVSAGKINALRTHSPDILSSGSEADISLYHTTVEGNFQSVALIPNTININTQGHLNKRSNTIGIIGTDDISSLDSISNHTFDDDEDLEHNLASLSPSSSLIDGLDDDDDDEECEGPEIDDDCNDGVTPTNNKIGVDVIPQYSAEEERRNSRNWQKITLPDGSTREIDMKVIEPYKRVLSHGGYLKAGGHNAIIIFCACHLPDRSRADYNYVMDNLFLYVVKTLEQLVTEDYVLIYLHGGTSRRNVPPFPWIKRCYHLLDRRLRKSLKNMYLVHPTFWIKSIVWMARPFVSTKFWRKLIYIKSLQELGTHIAVEKAAIPDKVKQYDARHN